ncbi:MAG: divalent-cation tolerance protein CutA [Candidatus Thorarchaeota archaeon]
MYCAVYTTVATIEDATNIGRTLVERNLVACANLIPQVKSIFRWHGQIEEEEEIILWCKTRTELVDQIRTTLLDIHPYDLPALAVYPIQSGSKNYLQWIMDETQSSKVD